MAKAKPGTLPDTRTLWGLLREYQEMLHDADRAVGKILAQDPHSEKFLDELSSNAHSITLVGDRSGILWEEIVELVAQLPED